MADGIDRILDEDHNPTAIGRWNITIPIRMTASHSAVFEQEPNDIGSLQEFIGNTTTYLGLNRE